MLLLIAADSPTRKQAASGLDRYGRNYDTRQRVPLLNLSTIAMNRIELVIKITEAGRRTLYPHRPHSPIRQPGHREALSTLSLMVPKLASLLAEEPHLAS